MSTKRSFNRASLTLLVTLALAGILAGCNSGQKESAPASVQETTVQTPVLTNEIDAKATSVTEAKSSIDAPINIMGNGSFEKLVDNVPAGWSVYSGQVEPSSNAKDGKVAVCLKVTEDKEASLVRRAKLPEPGNKTVRMTAQVFAADPGAALLAINYKVGKEAITLKSQPHPGNGQWMELVVEGTIPASAERIITANLFLRGDAKEPALFDAVTLTAAQ